MDKVYHLFSAQQWAIILAASANATAGAFLVYRFFCSRWWREMVVDPVTQRVVAGDLAKASSLVMGHTLTAAIAIAKLGFGRDPGLELVGLVGLLYGNSSYLQNVKRLLQKDVAAAANPSPLGGLEIKDSNVSVGPNVAPATPAPATETLAGYNDGPASITGSGPTFK